MRNQTVPTTNRASLLQREYMAQKNSKQPNFDSNVQYSTINDHAKICSAPTEVQPNVMNFTKLNNDSRSEQRPESKANYTKRAGNDICCSVNCKTQLIGLVIGVVAGITILALVLTMWLISTDTTTSITSTTSPTSATDTNTDTTTNMTATTTTISDTTTATAATVPIVCSTSNPSGTATTYSRSFTAGVAGSSQCTVWTSYVGQLIPRFYMYLRVSGSLDTTGVVICDPTVISNIAQALRTSTAYGPVTSNGRSWAVGPGGSQYALSASGSPSGNCPNPGYLVRPCSGNPSWGGINGQTCSASSQTLTVTFLY